MKVLVAIALALGIISTAAEAGHRSYGHGHGYGHAARGHGYGHFGHRHDHHHHRYGFRHHGSYGHVGVARRHHHGYAWPGHGYGYRFYAPAYGHAPVVRPRHGHGVKRPPAVAVPRTPPAAMIEPQQELKSADVIVVPGQPGTPEGPAAEAPAVDSQPPLEPEGEPIAPSLAPQQ